jgi:acetyl-CoA synthase
MSKLIASSAIEGAHRIVRQAEERAAQAIAAKGLECPVDFPNTAYSLPVIYSMLGRRVERLADFQPVLEECRKLLPPVPTSRVWLPYLGPALDAGMATLFAFELIEACKYLIGPSPVNGLWLGAADDVIIRERGIEFVDGSAPGFAAVVGAAPDNQTAARIARELQEKNLYVFMAGHTHEVTFAEQLAQAGVELGWDTRLVPYGREISAAIYALGFASRVALSFGGVKPGDYARNLRYNKDRVFAFVMALGEVDEEKYAAAAGAISYGFPTIADTDIPQILPTGICTYEHVVSSVPHERIVEKALEVRGCKVRITKVPIPVAYGPAFEGERVRKEQMHVEFGGNRTRAFEFVSSRDLAEVEDGKVTVVGPEIDEVAEGGALPLAIWVEVAGRKMQADFEPILERQIHHLINGGEGIWHMGQRDVVWVRISQAAKARGFKIRHLGEILHAKLLADYPAIVDKVQVTLYTGGQEVEGRLTGARHVYRERNLRLESLTDESVDTFYSCTLCQSFAPNHVCVITPERLGLCGAYNWLDGKAAYEIDPTGPNQPLPKGECVDPVRGQWPGIDSFVYTHSKQTIRGFSAYSILDHPMTSCGCFEAIVAVMPELNGVMIVNREYTGDTPVGMKFSTLAGVVGGGAQTPGFIGVGKAYISSRKFISTEGGQRRIVWMPRELKEALREDLEKVGQDLGIAKFLELIADESVGIDVASIRSFLEQVGHPALTMWEITTPSPEAAAVDAARRQATAAAPPPSESVPEEKAPPAPIAVARPPQPSAPALTAAAPVPPSSVPSAVPPAAGPAVTAPAAAFPPLPAHPLDGSLTYVLSVLERVRSSPVPPLPPEIKTPEEQMAALQMSTAVNLLTAGANMLLMYSGLVGGAAPVASAPPAPHAEGVASGVGRPVIAAEPGAVATQVAAAPPAVSQAASSAARVPARPVASVLVEESRAEELAAPPAPPRPRTSPTILMPSTFRAPGESVNGAIRVVELGSSGSRTAGVLLGGAKALPFRHFEGDTGQTPVVAMEVFDQLPKNYPDSLRAAYGDLLNDPARMARYCVEKLGAEVISVRLWGTHPDNGDRSPEEAADTVGSVLKAVGVPLIITGPSHYEKNNAVMKHVASTFAGENLLLNWVETDNYKTVGAAAMAYNHCLVAQTPIDVNLAKQLNILLTNLGLPPEKIVIDALTGALGYGLEYTYSVMERIRSTALLGDTMLAMPMLGTPGFEVAKIKECKAPESAFPLWGPEGERGALLEIATAMGLLNAGADLLIMYHPTAAATVRRKIAEMTRTED